MSQIIEAIYENGIFKPLSPVGLADGTRVQIEIPPASQSDLAKQIRQRLLNEGTDPDEIERILANLHLLWRSYDTLTEEQKVMADEARLDQEHFFDHMETP